MPIVLKSGRLNPLEPSGPVQACNGIALLFLPFILFFVVGYRVNFASYVGLCANRTCSQNKQMECYSWLGPLNHTVKVLTEHSTKKSAKKQIKNVFDLFFASPVVPFCCAPEHRYHHDMPRQMQDFCVIKLSCSGTRWTKRPWNLLICCKHTGSQS